MNTVTAAPCSSNVFCHLKVPSALQNSYKITSGNRDLHSKKEIGQGKIVPPIQPYITILIPIPLRHITNDQHKLQIQLSGHYNKVQFVKFHPLVKDVLASYSSDGGLKVWNCVTGDVIKSWQCDDVVAMNWNIVTGYDLLTVDKSGNVTTQSVSNDTSVTEVVNLEGKAIRNARLECTKDLVIISALLSGNVRSIYVLSHANSTLKSLDFLTFGIGTSIYVPFTDVDMNVVYLAARGESLILPHEFRESEPHIIPLATFSCPPVQVENIIFYCVQ